MVEITTKILKGRKAVLEGKPNRNGYIMAHLVNQDGSVQNEYIYVNINQVKAAKE